MTSSPSPFGKHLKSVATYLTRWVRSKPETKKNHEEPTPTSRPELHGKREIKEVVKPSIAPVAVRAKRVPVAKKITPVEKPSIAAEPAPLPHTQEVSAEPMQKKEEAHGILLSFSAEKNLVGQSLDLVIGGKKHNLIIRTDSLFLDAQKYVVTASGGALGADVELDILDCRRNGNQLSLKAGAFGKDATIVWTEKETEELFEHLLLGKACKYKTDRGQTLEIKRNNY